MNSIMSSIRESGTHNRINNSSMRLVSDMHVIVHTKLRPLWGFIHGATLNRTTNLSALKSHMRQYSRQYSEHG